MISMRLSEAAASINATLQGGDISFSGCSTDSRTLKEGELFIALRGERFDGHEFIEVAEQAGAAAAMVEYLRGYSLPTLLVEDTRKAMGRLAQHWRLGLQTPLVAITGSNGKTTVKEMVTSILRVNHRVLATQGNLNNDIGVPLTLFRLADEHQYAVVEMGANHPGEITWLSEIARPDVAVITQCAPAHLEGFGSVAGVAAAKAEIFSGLSEAGTAIINADDDFANEWLQQTAHVSRLTFALKHSADLMATGLSVDAQTGCISFEMRTPEGDVTIRLQIPGRHNVMNALAAAACGLALKMDLGTIQQGLEQTSSVPGRLQIKAGLKGARILDDTYNANPASLRAGLEVLNASDNRKWLALGDMGELGADAREIHEEAGEMARELGVERLYATGPLAMAAVQSFGQGARHFADVNELITAMRTDLDADVVVLVKGSRSMKMERVVTALTVGEEQSC